MARLFEGMVLFALGYNGRIEDKSSPGEVADFQVTANRHEVQLLVDRNRPDEPGHVWGDPVVRISSESPSYQLKFVRFFDWDQLAVRDFRLIEVRIERLEEQPDLAGRHALIELDGCSISLVPAEK